MAPIIAPGICRFTVNGTYGGEDVANIVDMQIDTTGSVEDRATACFSQAGIIINEWSDHILPITVTDYTAVSVSWVDLNSLSGSTGERTLTEQETWPQAGTGAGTAMPGNVALRIDKQTVAVRGQRQGRMYIPGVSEAWTGNEGPNILQANVLEVVNENVESFLGNINQEGGGSVGYASQMVVVHTVGGVFDSWSGVESLQGNPKVGSQSRRLR